MDAKLISHDVINSSLQEGFVEYESPSNIALVKYWGKYPVQIPANPSISFTLKNCKTRTKVSFKRGDFAFKVLVDGVEKESFRPKIEQFFGLIKDYLPFTRHFSFVIETTNSFPHSSGIASSASGMSALAMCLCRIESHLDSSEREPEFLKKASFVARIGSGSACRSIYAGLVEWGETGSFEDSSDYWGTPFYDYHQVFENYQDTILLVDQGEKSVSSSTGHSLMTQHTYAKKRFQQAHENIAKLKQALIDGDLNNFNEIVESEALTLHAMMMTSRPYFMLFKPNTVEIIRKVWEFREQTPLNLVFTLDAGANVHLLYPYTEKKRILKFIEEELVGFCENGQYICDEVGGGPTLLNEDYA